MWQTARMRDQKISRIAELLSRRNAIDKEIAAIIQRPMTSGHLGEWIASRIFDIELEASATSAAIDGRFRSGRLEGRTVNIKWYLKQEGVLDTNESATLDYYLVLTGPRSAAESSRGSIRPWCIQAVHLFDARRLRAEQAARGIKPGIASSVIGQQWTDVEIYPRDNNSLLRVTAGQVELLELLSL
jgi:hypothetical protein